MGDLRKKEKMIIRGIKQKVSLDNWNSIYINIITNITKYAYLIYESMKVINYI